MGIWKFWDLNIKFYLLVLKWYDFHYHYRVLERLLISHLFQHSLGQQVHYQLLKSCSKSCNKCKLINEAQENPEGVQDPEEPSQ